MTESVETVQNEVPETLQLTEVEQRAIEQGWRPKEQWDGNPEEWRSAKEFVDRGELFSKIHDLSSENRQIKEALKGLLDHHKKVKETEYQRAIDALRQQKREALETGDAAAVVQVEEAIDIVKQKQAEEKEKKETPVQNAPSPTYLSWVQNNEWYVRDQEMRQFADEIGVGYFNRNPGVTEAELYNYVAKRVKQTFADKFRGQGTKTPTVEGGTPRAGVKKDTFTLTEEEDRVMKTFVRTGVMTRDEYIAELKRVKGAS